MSRKETVLAIVLLTVIGTSMHFVHHVPFFNHFLGYIFPVVESVMAHMKMVFYPMLLLSLYLVLTRRDIREFGAPILGGLAVVPGIVGAFFSYWVFVRHEVMVLELGVRPSRSDGPGYDHLSGGHGGGCPAGQTLEKQPPGPEVLAGLDGLGRCTANPDRLSDVHPSRLAHFRQSGVEIILIHSRFGLRISRRFCRYLQP